MTRLTRRALALVSIVGGLLGVASPALADPPDPGPTPPSTSASTSAPADSPPPTVPVVPTVPTPDAVPVLTGRVGDVPVAPDAGSAPATPTAGDSAVRTGLAGDPPTATDVPTTSAPAVTPTGPVSPRSGSGSDGSRDRQPPSGAGAPAVGPSPATAPGTPPSVAAGASPVPPVATTYVVAPGDSLWSVSAAHLAAMTGRPAGSVPDATVAPYWQQVCAANRSRILSGDVNVIFPGEQITLPPVGT